MGFNWKTDGDFTEHDGYKDASSTYTEDFKLSNESNDWNKLATRGGDLASYMRTGVTISNGGHVSQPEYFKDLDVDTGTVAIDSFADTECAGCIWHVTISNATNARAMTVLATWDAGTDSISSTQTRVTTTPGWPSEVAISVDINSNNVRLLAVASGDNWVVTARRLQFTASSVLTSRRHGFITDDLDLYVATTGSDTAEGTVGDPWASPHRAFQWLRGKFIAPNATVTINCAAGDYAFTDTLFAHHPNGNRIELTGATAVVVGWEGVYSYSGTEPNKVAELYVSSASGITTDDFVAVRMKNRTVTRAEYCCGYHEVTAVDTGVDPHRITVAIKHNDALDTGTGEDDTTGDIVIHKTRFTFTGVDGIVIQNGNSLKSINNLGIHGADPYYGIVASYRGNVTLGSSVAIKNFGINLLAQYHGVIVGARVVSTNQSTWGILAQYDGVLYNSNGIASGSNTNVASISGASVIFTSVGGTYSAVSTGANLYGLYAAFNGLILAPYTYTTGASSMGSYCLYRSFINLAGGYSENNQINGVRSFGFSYQNTSSTTFTGNGGNDRTPASNTLGNEESFNKA